MIDEKGYGTKEEIRKAAEKIWDDMISFSQYAFPKAHSTAYTLIANATQYLKVHYPIEFFCSFLEQATDTEYNTIKGVSEKKYNVRYIMPEINTSSNKFVIHNNKIAWSLNSIKGIGSKAADEIVAKQPFDSFEDFFKRVNKTKINIKIVRTLIAANAFRKFGSRNKISKQYSKLRKDKERIKQTKEEWEAEAIKLMPYLKRSIKELFPNKIKSAISFEEFLSTKDGMRVVVAGFIEGLRIVNSKRGKMYIFRLTNSGESFNIVCWNSMHRRLEADNKILANGMAVKVSGFKGLSHMNEEQIALGHERKAYIRILKK